MQSSDRQPIELAAVLRPLREDPRAAAVLCDVDGTLAPIVERADGAAVPREAAALLAELARSYALVACISGRQASVARELVGLDELTYVGNHGYERLAPGALEPELAASLAGHAEDAAALIAELDPAELDSDGMRIEDKGPIRAVHWRGAPDVELASRRADEIAATAQERGLLVHWGRMVLEVRPPVEIDKGMAVSHLLAESPVRTAMYGGDDRTDLDAFRSLRELRARGELDAAVCIGVASDEGPAELAEQADALVDGTEGFLDALRALRPET